MPKKLVSEVKDLPEPLRGRPATISREQVFQTALAHLRELQPHAEISLMQIARELSVSGPAIYRYFPTRNALLRALSDHVFENFGPLDAALDWPEQLANWQDGLVELFQEYPSLSRLMGWGDELAPAWLMAQMPAVLLLRNLGFRGPDLVEVSTWFFGATVGFLRVQIESTSETKLFAHQVNFDSSLPLMTPEMKAAIEETRGSIQQADAGKLRRAGLDVLIEGVRQKLATLRSA